jgi:hypothetical protein
MSTTNFVDQETPIVAAWLNDVDEATYTPPIASPSSAGHVRLATSAEANAGADVLHAMTPSTTRQAQGNYKGSSLIDASRAIGASDIGLLLLLNDSSNYTLTTEASSSTLFKQYSWVDIVVATGTITFAAGSGSILIGNTLSFTGGASIRLTRLDAVYWIVVATQPQSTDGTLVGNSDFTIPTEKAVKTYVDTGVVDGSDAPAGAKGEYIQGTQSSLVSISHGVSATHGAITLQPGDWDVWGISTINTASTGVLSATTVLITGGVNLHKPIGSLTLTSGATLPYGQTTNLTRVSISTPTSIGVVLTPYITSGSLTAAGQVFARRVR